MTEKEAPKAVEKEPKESKPKESSIDVATKTPGWDFEHKDPKELANAANASVLSDSDKFVVLRLGNQLGLRRVGFVDADFGFQPDEVDELVSVLKGVK